jgi:transcriptional regulator with XRE-family HTH domain
MTVTAMQLATRLKDWREQQDITQAQAAEQLGLSLRTYHGIEQGRGFRFDRLLALALAKIDPKELRQ